MPIVTTRYNPNHVLHRLLPNLKIISFVNAHTISHYLQTSVLLWNRTLYIECCSEISINLVFRSQCYFASIFYSTAYVFRIISFCFLSCMLFCVACAFVICLIKYLLTYLCGAQVRRSLPWSPKTRFKPYTMQCRPHPINCLHTMVKICIFGTKLTFFVNKLLTGICNISVL